MAIQPGDPQPPHGQADYGYGTNYPVQADIRPDSAEGPGRARSGIATGAVALLGLLLKFKGLALTFVTTVLSALLYARLFGWWSFAIGFALLILVHETAHLVMARALGLPTGLPIMIPGLGAFVNVRQRPRTVVQEAQIAISGPIVGTLAAAGCYLAYLASPGSYWGGLFGGLAYFGFLINLFNLVPVTPLDGGRVMSVVSKWFNVAGLLIAAGLLALSGFSNPVLILIVIVGAFSTWQRFRSSRETPQYYDVPVSQRWVIGGLYLILLLGLALGVQSSHGLISAGR